MDAQPTPPPLPEQAPLCRNCGAEFSTPFCPECGQKAQVRRVTLWLLIADYVAHSFAYDSRLWRTLVPLVTRPGFVTEQNLKERWVSFLPPIRTYLVISLLFFAAFTSVIPDRVGGIFRVTNSQDEQVDSGIPTEDLDLFPEGWVLTDKLNEMLIAKIEYLNEMDPKVRDVELYRAFVGAVPTTLIVALPLFAAGLKILYLLRRRYFFDHFVFATHFYSLWLLVLVPSLLVNKPWIWIAGHAVYLPIALYVSLRRVYQQHWFPTIAKMVLLGIWQIFSVSVLAITVLLTALITV